MKRKNPAAVALGRISTPAKRRAAKQNGRLGGRKPKFLVGDAVRANDQAPSLYAGMGVGAVVAIGPRRAEYRVRFAGREVAALMSWWLDPVTWKESR